MGNGRGPCHAAWMKVRKTTSLLKEMKDEMKEVREEEMKEGREEERKEGREEEMKGGFGEMKEVTSVEFGRRSVHLFVYWKADVFLFLFLYIWTACV